MTEFTVQGKPKGKGRPRFYQGHAVTPPETRRYEAAVRSAFVNANGYKHQGAIAVSIEAHFQIPQSATKAKKAAMLRHDVRPSRRPDADNIIKIVLDALNGLAYDDDSQVVSVACSKWWSLSDQVIVTVREVKEERTL